MVDNIRSWFLSLWFATMGGIPLMPFHKIITYVDKCLSYVHGQPFHTHGTKGVIQSWTLLSNFGFSWRH